MAKMKGTYIWVVYKNVFGHISTNSWLFFMIKRPNIREKCVWVRSNTWRDERPVATGLDRFFRFFDFSTNLTTGNRKISEFVQLQPVVQSFAVGFSSISVFFQSSEVDLRTLYINIFISWVGLPWLQRLFPKEIVWICRLDVVDTLIVLHFKNLRFNVFQRHICFIILQVFTIM